MSSKQHRSFHTETSNEANARAVSADPSNAKYDLLYFQISCIGATPRHILSYGKANWTNRFPKDWKGNEEYDTPFGVMPVLTVRTDNEEAVLAESIVVDLYLAKKFGLLGSNEYEEQTIKAFYSSIHYLRERSLRRLTWTFEDKRKEAFETWITKDFPNWIVLQEEHLKRNGSNGHFFGDKITLADIHLASILDHFAELPRGNEIVDLFRASPLLWKVRENVLQNPSIAEWRQSDEFQSIVQGGKNLYSATAF
ncbi:Glutathione S-transferase S1 [Modicella reniformis]|uniref:glutathione transferase n=1 Tax=Modicella reniformis TaxID=1440133 RepID=A0A9P6SU61_9FUNG|nr:Glutathione S-transferase S1 [Modicella reniformis]